MLRISILVLLVVGLATGCSDGMSEADSRKAMIATAGALTSGSAEADADANKADGLAFTHGCDEGGSLLLEGPMSGISIGFDLGVKLTTCTRNGITMTGELTYVMVAVNAILVTTSTFQYAGTVTFSGDVSGTCDVAMTGTTVGAPGVSIATWAGKFCDHDGDKVMAGVDIRL